MNHITESNCVIDLAVAHVVDNRNDKLVLADLPVSLDDELSECSDCYLTLKQPRGASRQ
jgi:hypothetical protein